MQKRHQTQKRNFLIVKRRAEEGYKIFEKFPVRDQSFTQMHQTLARTTQKSSSIMLNKK